MTTILERLDRMERDLSRLNREMLDLRSELTDEAPEATPLRATPTTPVIAARPGSVVNCCGIRLGPTIGAPFASRAGRKSNGLPLAVLGTGGKSTTACWRVPSL